MTSFLGKGWRYTVGLDRAGGVAMSDQDEAVRQSIFVILGTAPGERVMRPTFGCEIHDLLYAPNNQGIASLAAHYVESSLQKWEPRIRDIKVDASPSREEPNRLDVMIRYRIRANNVVRNLVYPFYLRKNDEP